MSKLEEFLKKHCPDGVEYTNIGNIAIVTKLAGFEFTKYVNYSNKGKIIALRGLNVKNGKLNLNEVKYIDESDLTKLTRSKLYIDDMLFTYVGTIGEVALIDENDKYYLAPNVALIRFNKELVISNFMKYYFQSSIFFNTQINKLLQSSSMKNIPMEKIRKFSVPLPPIKVQEEIVRILDTFTKYQDLLNRELELRKKQYEYYRNYLFNKIQSYDNVFLGDIADISVGSKPEFISENKTEFEYINAGTTNSGYTNNYNCLGDTVTTPSRGQGGIGYIGYQKNNFWLGALCYQIRSNKDYILTKYIYYYLKNNNELILKIKNSGGLPSVNRNDLIKINIKFPNLEYQKEIINILDQFDTLCNDITKGLPAEIEMRKKQYEYYRDKLLTFKEKKK